MSLGDLEIIDRTPLGGGCISRAERIRVKSGREFLLKQHSGSEGASMLAAEAAGLEALWSEAGPRVPAVENVWTEGRTTYLLMEYIESGARPGAFFRDFGVKLARLHRERTETSFGFSMDNFIGSTPQPNPWTETWIGFFAEYRLGYQIRLARTKGLLDKRTVDEVEGIISRLDLLLVEPEQASILHGDLWGGNYLVDASGEPVIIDPAVFYGHREADLAMTELFGGFSPDFYRAYEEEWPLQPGYRERRDLYNLYHMLNHLNIFGSGYSGAVKRICSKYR